MNKKKEIRQKIKELQKNIKKYKEELKDAFFEEYEFLNYDIAICELKIKIYKLQLQLIDHGIEPCEDI